MTILSLRLTRAFSILIVWVGLSCSWLGSGWAQLSQRVLVDTDAVGRMSWSFHSTDTRIRPGSWDERPGSVASSEQGEAISGRPNRWERVSFHCGSGSEVLIACPIEPLMVIPELEIRVPVQSEQAYAQLMIEVTFPNTPSPIADGPLKAIVRGPKLETTGWQVLTFGGRDAPISDATGEAAWLLRNKYGIPIDLHQAFIDRILLNVYSRPGNHCVYVAAPEIKGNVPADRRFVDGTVIRDFQVRQTGFQTEDERPPAKAQRDGTVVEVEGKPFFPRVVQHNGEGFAFLKQMGFNVVQLPTTATSEQLRQARELDLWLVCPPPPSTGLQPMGALFDPVIAWSMGEGLTRQNLTATENLAREIRTHDSRKNRPLIGGIETHWNGYAQRIDVLAVGQPVLGTFFPMRDFDNWMSDLSRTVGGGHPIWVDLPTEHPQVVLRQAGYLTGQTAPMPIPREDLETLTMQAVAGGARGFRFLSRSRLDAEDLQTQLRVQTLRWLNQRLLLMEPWIMGGAVMGQVATGDDQLQVTAIKTNRSQLLLIQQQTGVEQFVSGDAEIRTVRFQDTYSAIADQAYLLTDYGLLPLAQNRSNSTAEIQIDACPSNAIVVLTQDPMVLQRLNQTFQQWPENAMLFGQAELARQWLAVTELVESRCSAMGRSTPIASGNYNEALAAYQQADALIRSGSPVAAAPMIEVAGQRLAASRRELLSLARDQFAASISDPLLYHVSLLPLHWELAARMRDQPWSPNGLAGGDFENIDHMENNGWRYSNTREPGITSDVNLVQSPVVAGGYALQLEAKGSLPPQTLIPEPAITVESAPVRVMAGQMVFVHGWVRIDQALRGTYDGLRIFDSLGGRSLAYSTRQTNGWQEFKLYRGVGETSDMRVTFELNGIGTVQLDEVTIRTINLPLANPTSPPSQAARPDNNNR